MDRSTEKQAFIHDQRNRLIAGYPALWQSITTNWGSSVPEDRGWLIYSANYLFRTGGVRWAIDPLMLSWRLRSPAAVVDPSILGSASFVLLTHRHADHLDLNLLSALRHFPIRWVVPEPILGKVTRQGGIPRESIVVPEHLYPLELNGLRITPFQGLHGETTSNGALKGVPSMGYLVEFKGKRWLFPGDTRTYDAARIPINSPSDILFAHLWLGRGQALQEPPPLLDEFCRFCLDLQPRKIILAHLREFGRDANDFWDETHLPMVLSKFKELSPNIPIQAVLTGESIPL